MRLAFWLGGALVVGSVGACSLFLDTESLQGGGGGSVASSGQGGGSGSSTTTGAGGSSTTTGAGGTGGSSGGVDGGDAAATGVSLDNLAPALARAVCDNLNACYASALEVLIHDEDCQTLFTSLLQGTVVAPIKESVQRDLVTYDPAQAASCLANVAQGTLKSPPTCADFNAVVEDCKRALGKLAGAGDPCRHRYECKKGLSCDTASTCPGTCKAFAGTGSTCALDADCDPTAGLYCQKIADAGDADGGLGSCQPFVAINADCMQNRDQCAPGALCIERKCRRWNELFTLAETFACYGNGLLCQRGLYCEFSGLPLLSMAACVPEKMPLDACKLSLPGECPKDTYCSANAFNGAGRCLVTPVENQRCAADFEQSIGLAAPCKAGLTCVNGICKSMRQLGEPCEIDGQCYSATCRAGDAGSRVCVPSGCP